MISAEYAAGYLDGEGCFSLDKRATGWAPKVIVQCTYEPVLMALRKRFGGNIYSVKQRSEHHKAQYRWELTRHSVVAKALHDILPFLIEKQEQALTLLEYVEERIKHKHDRFTVDHDYAQYISARLKELKK